MPFDDTYLMEDEFETQMANLAEETQMANLAEETQVVDLEGETLAMDLDGETQMVDFGDETQMVDLYEETQVVDLPGETQVLDEFNAELDLAEYRQTNKTDVTCETQRLSEEDSANIDGSVSVELDSTVDKDPPKEEDLPQYALQQLGLLVWQPVLPGDLPQYVLHQLGLLVCQPVAEELVMVCLPLVLMYLLWNNRHLKLDGSSLVGHVSKSGRKSDGHFLENDCNSECERNSNRYKIPCTAVRKLFGEDQDAEVDKSETEINQKDDNHDMPELLASDSMAGLSYVNSQEPGELSQAHALEVVDRFLDLSFMEHDEGFGKKVQDVHKPKGVSAAKGSRDLAKRSTLQNTVGERGIYDWDDTREDDGGGEFFLKKKELFFDNEGPKPRCFTEPRKSKSLRDSDKKEKPCTKTRLGDLLYSDSGLLHKTRSKQNSHGEEVVPKNIIENLEEQLHVVSGPEVSDNCADKNILDIRDIGPDTQMAAEAMGDLCFEVHLSDSNKSAIKLLAAQKKLLHEISREILLFIQKNTCHIPLVLELSLDKPNEQRGSAPETVVRPLLHRIDVSAPGRGKRKNAVTMTIEEVRRVGLTRLKQSNKTCDKSSTSDINVVGNLQEKRSRPETSADRWCSGIARSSEVAATRKSRNDAAVCVSDRLNEKSIPDDAVGTSTSKQGDEKDYDEAPAGGAERDGRREASPRCGTPYSTCATPTTRTTLRHEVSPICMGDEYHKQSCRKNLSAMSLMKELDDLRTGSSEPCSGMRESRKRKDITTIRVLFSQHLDVDVVNKQKKILARLGGTVVSSMLDATHFVADEFVRTRNMLEAIASGKPVVTSSWIESCGQASCLIDEKNYILRDAKKEKEFGFCLPVSLARASQHPLLQGQKVFVTPNTKPGKDIIVNLVKAVHGLPVERLGRSVFKDEQLPDDLLILSCEEDYEACVPFLEKGGTIYSSELLLNGIVKQKLEYERHGLFTDHVKRTRSTMWLKKTNKFLPVKG
ncbi:uncharacterized protein LOC131023650 [Salvia miltiorrhiza]|uniref:uncharacterized protein LOC131023650 n=1 Tax=Salvia miltiorrhiza TaxID=226208 RepID=UPI0025AB6918|nr:uncharacterized protein LOC131023650 [Salvia miltiorrhiza]